DKQEEIDTIIWTVSGKVKEIRRSFESTKKNLTFEYDAFGNRIAKHVYDNQTLMLEKSTYYILDAQGNQLSMYEHAVKDTEVNYYLTERNIYGSSRLGTLKDPVNMFNAEPLPSYGILGNRNYELSNYLGNVLTVISDIKYPLSDDNTTITGYEVGISNIFDYSPFGAPLDGRTVENFIAPIFDSIYVEELDANYSSDFNASNYALPTYDGWSATNGDNVALGITNSRLRIESTATSQGAQKRFSTQSGRKVYVSFNLDRGTASQVKMSAEDIDSQENHTLNETESYTSNGVKTFVFTANENEFTLKLTGNGTFSVKDIVIKDSTFMLVDFTDFENPVYIEPLVDKWTYNPKNTKVYFENSAVHFEPNKNEPIKWNQSFSATVSPSNTYRVRGNFTFENTANSQKSMDLMLYRLNTAGTAIVDSLIVATITSDGAFNYVLPITISTSYIIGWKTSKSAKFKLTSYSVTVSVTGSFSYTLNLQTGIFNNPQIIKPSYDGWTIDTKRQNLIYSDKSTHCILPNRGIHKNFITQINGQYKFSGDVKYLGSAVIVPPLGLADTEEETIIPQSLSTPDSLKITNISSTPVRITGVQFNGTTQIEKNFQATSNATQIEFLLGSVLEIGYAYYVDNLKLEKIVGGSTLYTSSFTTQEIVSFDLDGWKTNWETSYLSATTDTPSRFRVAGETPQTNRLFNVSPGLEYELSYTQSENNSVSFSIEESDNGTSWQNIVSSSSSNGSQTVNFIPSASFLKVSFEASAGFKLQNVSLNGELFDTLVVAKILGRTGYRYGFGGHEKDDEIKGSGNHYSFGDYGYDPRIGRRWNVDPEFKQIAGLSPYAYALNNPNVYIDEDGKLPILPLLLKAGAAGAADMLAQAAMAYYFDPEVKSASQAIEKVNWWQVSRSAAEGLIPWKTPGGKIGRAAATATGDVLVNAISEGSNYSTEQALQDFAVGFIGDLAGGGFGELLSKYGSNAVAKGLSKMGFDNKKIEELFTGAGTTWKGPVDYSDIPDPRNAAAGKKFTTNQKAAIKDKNQAANNGYLRSDQDGTFLNPGQKGGSDPLQAEIDHITPKSTGGSNSNSNAQVLSKKQNLTKTNK
ncbi:MAG TPA: hypothetical protein VL021_07755, partial [Brumimicrobium sp.]|nr:hypothetical protein [Brumimicrobium sp.]